MKVGRPAKWLWLFKKLKKMSLAETFIIPYDKNMNSVRQYTQIASAVGNFRRHHDKEKSFSMSRQATGFRIWRKI